jgi:16S rRNA processing protein RimM
MSGTSRLEVGRIGRAHGLRGEVSVTLGSERAERLEAGSTLFVGDRALVVRSARPHSGRWLVCFEGIEDRTDAEAMLGLVLTGEPLPTQPGELWVHELIGAAVRDRAGTELGTVTAVEANPASDLLVLDDAVLVPMAFVVEQGPGLVVVDPPDGLLDVNKRD